MDIEGSMMTSTIIDLNEREKQLFDFFLDYIAAKEVDVIPRSAGGWVRDKVIDFFRHVHFFSQKKTKFESFVNYLFA